MQVAIDPRTETLCTLRNLKDHIQAKPCYRSVKYWVDEGRKTLSGDRIKLESINLSSGVHTSVEAYYRFIHRLNE